MSAYICDPGIVGSRVARGLAVYARSCRPSCHSVECPEKEITVLTALSSAMKKDR